MESGALKPPDAQAFYLNPVVRARQHIRYVDAVWEGARVAFPVSRVILIQMSLLRWVRIFDSHGIDGASTQEFDA